VSDGTPPRPGHDLVRPFIMTGGRTSTNRPDVRIETLVQRANHPVPRSLPFEQEDILRLSDEPISVAALAAELDLVLGVVTVLVNDLLDAGFLEVLSSGSDHVDLDMLNRIADKIRSL
jgi:hypothetical protein